MISRYTRDSAVRTGKGHYGRHSSTMPPLSFRLLFSLLPLHPQKRTNGKAETEEEKGSKICPTFPFFLSFFCRSAFSPFSSSSPSFLFSICPRSPPPPPFSSLTDGMDPARPIFLAPAIVLFAKRTDDRERTRNGYEPSSPSSPFCMQISHYPSFVSFSGFNHAKSWK